MEANPVDAGQSADVNGDGLVDINDLFEVIEAWGCCPFPPQACPADINGDVLVDFDDLVLVLANWS